MFITEALWIGIGRRITRRVPGRIWTGKHRLAHHIFEHNLIRFRRRVELEDQNLFYLRHPYLKVDQERMYSQHMKLDELKVRSEEFKKAVSEQRHSIRMEDRLSHLNTSSTWDK